MSSSVVSTHAFFYTFACAPPCGDTIITSLLAVPVALCCIAVGARGRSLHLRLRARSSMRSRIVARAPKHLRLDVPMGEFEVSHSCGCRRSVGYLPSPVPAHLFPELVELLGCQWFGEYVRPVLVGGYPSHHHTTSSDILANFHRVPIDMRQVDAVTAWIGRDLGT